MNYPAESLRILVVDDDQQKLRSVVNTLRTIPGCSASCIDTAQSSIQARQILRDHQYDLMILDIALPERAEDFPSPDGGIKLLEEVLERDIYVKPREVVGLTAFPDVLESAGRRFSEDLWLVVHYDPTTDAWAHQLQRKVRYILLAKRSAPLPDYKTYLCVVTALPDPELSAVLRQPWSWQPFEQTSDPTVYHRGHLLKEGKALEVIAAASPRTGMISTAVLAMKMVAAFRPRYLAIVGILAGIQERCARGDIISADPSWDWGSGKFYTEGKKHLFAPAPYQINLNSFIRSKMSLFASSQADLDEIRRGWEGRHIESVLRMHVGPVASGASVLQDADIASAILQQHRKLIGIEMETYSVFAAADESPLPQPKAFSLKSVSDFADERKNDEFQKYAAYTSASALRIFVERYL